MSKTFRIIEIFDTQMIAFLNIEQRKFLIRRTFFLQYNIEKKISFYSKNDVYYDQYLCHYL